MRRLRLRDEGGFSLIELLVVMAILGIVLSGVTTVFISGSRAELQVNNRFQAQEASRLAMAAIRKDVHGACAALVTGTNGSILTCARARP
jgi:prepilin-type N-terminal cleavage/methylation domain-containing protein